MEPNQQVLVTVDPNFLKEIVEQAVEKAMLKKMPDALPVPVADDILSVKEAAKLLDITEQTIYHYTKNREIPFMRKGRRVYFSKADILNFLRKDSVPTADGFRGTMNTYIKIG